jgi:alpha-L-fucosidase
MKSMKTYTSILLLAFALACAARGSENYEAKWESLDKRPAPEWYSDAKFGIFIHWGVYSVPSWAPMSVECVDGLGEYSEWYWFRITTGLKEDRVWREFHERNYGKNFDYKDFAPRFTAELFDAGQWADLFARSGAKYIVPTSKHHDGFALWPSAEASRTWGRPWNATEIGPMRDVMGELAGAVRARGLKFGFYFSLYEWHNPLWLADRPRYIKEHMFPQFKDVVTRYRPSIIFSDGEWDLPSKEWGSEELVAWLYNESPSKDEVIINDRWGKETRHKHGGYWTTEYGAGLADGSHAWEESRGLGFSYALNRAERIGDYKTARELLFVLIDLVSRGGNLLLDIGPAADGTIPPLMEERLLEMGAWLGVNGEAIYGTRPAGRSCQWTEGARPQQEYGEYKIKYELMDQIGQAPKDGRAVKQVFFTQKPGALYAITAGWPGKQLALRGVRVPAGAEVTMPGVAKALAYTASGDSIIITTPDFGPDGAPCRDAFVFKITGAVALPEKDQAAGK